MRKTLPQSCPLARNLGLILIFSVAIIVPWDSSARVRREPRAPQPNLPLLPVAQVVRQTNLVSDRSGLALIEDPFLINPWGVALTANGPFWVVNNATDVATIYQGDVSGSPFVRNSGLSLVGVVFSAAERDALVSGLGNGTETRATVLRKIAEKESFRQKEFNSAFVLMEYFGYLRRFPGSPPDFNLDGFNFWLDKLNAFNGDFVRSEMVKAFITSIEYRSRFGPP